MNALVNPKYRSDIDGLRAVAVLAVVGFHAFPGKFPGGFIGVDIFFVISGFLISTIIFESIENGNFKLTEFYVRRIRRIFPALITTLLGVYFIGWLVLIGEELNELGKQVAASVGFITNFLFASEAGYFDTGGEYKPLLHLWSLAIEEQFYIFWPAFLWIAWKQKLNLFNATLIIAIASLFLNLYLVEKNVIQTFYFPQTRIWELLSGSAIAWIKLKPSDYILNFRRRLDKYLKLLLDRLRVKSIEVTPPNALSLIGIAVLFFGFTNFDKTQIYPGWRALIPVFGSLSVILAGSSAWFNKRVLSHKILVWFGLISYSLYLWHWPFISFSWIVYGGPPPTSIRCAAILLAMTLAWLTTRFIESSFRYGAHIRVKITTLCVTAMIIGLTGLTLGSANFAKSRGFLDLAIPRKGSEYAIGNSLKWYEGKNYWLFLGNNYDKSVAKLTLAIVPNPNEVKATKKLFSRATQSATKYGTRLALIIGPNKESIYPEQLPDRLAPSLQKYSGYFINDLRKIPNLTVYDPTYDLVFLKKSQGLLYMKTDTHWNSKGAYLSLQRLLSMYSIPVPKVKFQMGNPYSGDLIAISKQKNFPLDTQSNWEVLWKDQPSWTLRDVSGEEARIFGNAKKSTNQRPISDKTIWVIGDSFSFAMMEFLNATFKEVVYLGHWSQKLEMLPSFFDEVKKRPDLVIIVRVERSF
jgi:peptidoglycan/LPS O-acetylase OafA/YrhL